MNTAIALMTMILGASHLLGALGYPVPLSPWFALPHVGLYNMTLIQIVHIVSRLRKNKLDEEEL